MTVSLTGLQPPPGNKWHVHVDPVVNFGDCAATGGHYEPLTPTTSPPKIDGDYEIGDLSGKWGLLNGCLLYTSPSPRDRTRSRMPSSA